MKEQHENLYAHLRELTENAKKTYEARQKEHFEKAWEFLKKKMENAGNAGLTHITIFPNGEYIWSDCGQVFNSYENTILKNCNEILWRLKILGFSQECFSVTKKESRVMKLMISWGDDYE